jgi:hypothetical protein
MDELFLASLKELAVPRPWDHRRARPDIARMISAR